MTDTVQLEFSVLLPDVADTDDACVARLRSDVGALAGVESVHVEDGSGQLPPRLCIHYDRDAVSLRDVQRAARRSGARLTDEVGHALWTVEGLTHERRARTVGTRLERLDGVLEATASASGVVRVEYERARTDQRTIIAALHDLGVRVRDDESQASLDAPTDEPRPFTASPDPQVEGKRSGDHVDQGGHDHAPGGIFGERTELVFALAAGVAYVAGLLVGWLSDLPHGVSIAFYLAAYGFGGFFTVREAVDTIRAGRFEVDFLMLVAAAGAGALGKWAEGAVLLFLFSLGHALEHYAMGRARRAIEALAALAPKTALVRRGAEERELLVEVLRIGDVVIVRPNERIPADGVVIAGESIVDQAPITGESIPVEKRPANDPEVALSAPERIDVEHRVFAGTINGSGVLEVAVTHRAQDNTLARVVRMVQEAETQRSPTQRFTDRFERVFVPAVLVLVALLLLAGLVIDEPFSDTFYRAMAVLVAASPCALAISTPSAVLSGVARAARGGVLIKGGAPLEHLGTLTAIAFDKTGTLTEGRPRLTDVVAADGVSEQELLRVAVAIERLSDHPLAAAVVRDGLARLDGAVAIEASDMRAITGRGVSAQVGGRTTYLGNAALMREIEGAPVPEGVLDAAARLAEAGRTTMILRHGDRYLGALGLMDTPRADAAPALARLHDLGIRRTIMISGDNQHVATAIAEQVGLDQAWGDLMPEDKVDALRRLSAEEGRSAMVGDGVNDAPAMANATVGIAMGAAGSDVALETADVALMSDRLSQLPFAVGLSRRTSRIIKQNLLVSLGIVVVLVPATILGLGIGPAVLVHEGSTLIVVGNALRLLAYRDDDRSAV